MFKARNYSVSIRSPDKIYKAVGVVDRSDCLS
jgi:hypothetical protein